MSSSFKIFCQILKNHSSLQHYHAIFHEIYRKQQHNERCPETYILWKNYLQTILDLKQSKHPLIIYDDLAVLAQELIELSDFITKEKINNILIRSKIILLLKIDLQNFINKIYHFAFYVRNWDVKHQLLLTNPLLGLETIAQEIKEDPWKVALLLNQSGYLFPCSIVGAKIWQKYNALSQKLSYSEWYQLLTETINHRYEMCQIDFILTQYFLKQTSYDCLSCIFLENCKWYHQKLAANQVIKNNLSLGYINNINNTDLLLYILDDDQEQLFPIINNFIEGREITLFDLQENRSEKDALYKLYALQELYKRDLLAQQKIKEEIKIGESKDVFQYCQTHIPDFTQEGFYLVILNTRNHILCFHMVSKGLLNKSLVHPREVFAPAIQLRAAKIILVHNHPSGDPTPSKDDYLTTNRLKEVGQLLGITVIDHIIIGKKKFYSFVDNNEF